MLRAGGGILALLPSPQVRRVYMSKLSENAEKALPFGPKFISLGAGDANPCEISSGFKFRIVSYNILAQAYVKSSLFPHSPSPCLRWKVRSDKILTVLDSLEADFLCLQELDEFDSFYRTKLESIGYSGIYIKRTGRKRDGCGIFYKANCAELVSKEEIQYNDLVDLFPCDSTTSNEHTEGLKGSQKVCPDDRGDPSDPRVRLKRDCVGILVAFKFTHPSEQVVIIANTHIYWDPEWIDVKLAQVEHLLSRLSRFKEHVSKKYNCAPSVVLAGDFNSTPGDKVYQCLTSGKTPNYHNQPKETGVPLCSLYASIGGEPPFTNCTPDFTGTLDYIFFCNTGELKPIGYLEIPGPESPEVTGGLPNYHHPSDHLPIGGDFEVGNLTS